MFQRLWKSLRRPAAAQVRPLFFEPLENRQLLNGVVHAFEGVPAQPISWVVEPAPRFDTTGINFKRTEIQPYGTPTSTGTHEVVFNGAGLKLTGDTRVRIDMFYQVTANTVIEVDFQSNAQGGLHAIGFDDDTDLSLNRLFKLYGTQSSGIVGTQGTYQGDGWQSFRINIGAHYTGRMNHLVLINTDPAAAPASESWFYNIRVYEAAPRPADPGPVPPPPADDEHPTIDFGRQVITGYDPAQDVAGQAIVRHNGATLHMVGNTWKKIALPYTVTPNTILEFDFRSDSQGEVHGVGFDNNNVLTPEWFFKVWGTQSAPIEAHANYAPSGWTRYRIEVGQFFSGAMQYLTFGMDDDVSNPKGESMFANVRVYEAPGAPPLAGPPAPPALPPGVTPFDLTELNWITFDSGKDRGEIRSAYDGDAIELYGNAYKQIILPGDIRPNTVLSFDVRIDVAADILAVGLEVGNAANAVRMFQLAGTRDWGYQDFRIDPDQAGEWVRVRIELGQFYGGHAESLVLISHLDASPVIPSTMFANLVVYDDPSIDALPIYSAKSGYGMVDAKRAVELALGVALPEVPAYGGAREWNLNVIGAPEVWDAGYTGQGIIVAVLDTGVNINHPDLAANIWRNPLEQAGTGVDNDGNGYKDDIHGWNFVDDNNDLTDLHGHGTLVSGIIGALRNNTGATGVAPDVKIMPLKIIDGFGNGTFEGTVKAIEYAVRNGARVINMSLSFASGSPQLEAIIQWAASQGVIVVAAAGGDAASTPTFPATYADRWGLAVGSSDAGNKFAAFSNQAGPTPIDYVVAPGVNIYTTNRHGTYSTVSASSWSAPHVAGIAALVLSARPNLTNLQVETIIVASANQAGLLSL